MKFYKMNCNGNDFVIFINRSVNENNLEKTAKKICDRHFGVGADGVILASESNLADVKMTIFNADGSKASNCGNGLRCLAKLYNLKFHCQNHVFVETDSGVFETFIDGDVVNCVFTNAKIVRNSRIISKKLNDYGLKISKNDIYFIDVGNKHLVCFCNFPAKLLHEAVEKIMPNLKPFNLETVKQADNKFLVKFYENGCGYTLSCGTGTVAIGKALYNRYKKSQSFDLVSDGGIQTVKIVGDNAILSSVCQLNFEGNYEI